MKGNKKTILTICLIILASFLLVITLSYSNFEFISNIKSKLTETPSVLTDGPRKKYNFNYDWKFAKGVGYINRGSDLSANPVETYTSITDTETPYMAEYSTLNDERWTNVSLAHTFNDIDTFNNFTESGMNGERSQYTGTSWYKKEFYVPSTMENKKIYIEFEAARQAAEVYINGTKLTGKYLNGFIPFGYDLTEYINYNATNQITVMVDNTYPYYLDGVSYIPWHNPHWHPNFGGLYRNSYLYIMDSLHLTLPLYSFLESEGTYVYTTNENAEDSTALVHVDAEVENNKAESQTFTLKSTIYNAELNPVLVIESEEITLDRNEKRVVQTSGTLNNVIRWSTEYPYLYNVKTEIIQNNSTVDNNTTPLGIRTFRFTNDYGFYLNEHYVELNGWGQKSTMEYAGLGAAYPDWMTDNIIKLMKDAGSNYIRWGHVAGSPSQISASDKYGILVTQPGVDGEGLYVNTDYGNAALKLRAEAFRDTIIYYRNNPSIVMWEMGNQLTSTDKVLSGEYFSGIKGLSDYGTTSASLAEIIYYFTNKYDYGNRTTAVSGTISNAGAYESTTSQSERILGIRRGGASVKNYVEIAETTDGQAGSGMSTDALGNKPTVEAEYNRYEASRGIWNNITNDTFVPQNTYHMDSEEFALSQVTTYNGMLSASINTGGANWLFSDSTSHGRVNTLVGRLTSEVDATMLPKEAYYVDSVIFGDNPSSYIIGHWNYTTGTIRDVKVVAKGVSNLKLFVNETEYTGALSDKYIWTFAGIPWVSGTLTARGYDSEGALINSTVSSISTHGTPSKIRLTQINNPEGIKANGSDIILVDAEILDENNNRCITYDGESLSDLMTFNIMGDTNSFIWRGGYNSRIEGSTNVNTLYLESGISRVAIKTTLTPGTINLSASTTSGLTLISPLSITSLSISNTDSGVTGVSEIEKTTPYSLTSLTDPGYGDGTMLGQAEETLSNSSVLIESMSYTGTHILTNGIKDAFSTGKKIYSDSDFTFTEIPFKYLNSEYLLLPNADANHIAADFIVFASKRDIDVYILRDPASSIPEYLSNYTLTNDTIIGGNGVEYEIYKKSYLKGESITIQSNIDNLSDLNNGYNQIVVVKETEKINNLVFFKEDFTDFNHESIKIGWNAKITPGNSILVDNSLDGDTLHFIDNSTDISYIQKSFAPMSKFKLKYRAYITDDVNSNSWLRVFLTNGQMTDENDKTGKVAIETYMDSNTSGVFYGARSFTGIDNTAPDTITKLFSNLSYNAWNDFELEVNAINHTYRVKVNGKEYASTLLFWARNSNTLDNVVFGTWIGGNSNYYIDDVEIIPIPTSVISNVKVNGNVIDGFRDDAYEYYIEGINSSSVIIFDEGYYYKSSTLNYNSTEGCFELTVTDLFDTIWTYKIYNKNNNPLFDGWALHPATNALINASTVGEEEAIHFIDTNTSAMTYMERTINPLTTKYSVSFDFYIPSNSYANKWNRVFLSNGPQIDVNTKTNVAVESYFQKNNKIYTYHRFTDTNNVVQNIEGTIPYNLGEWHNYKIVVDENTSTYSIYIDNVLDTENAGFLHSVSDINNLIIGTGSSSLGEFYVKNFVLENIYANPIIDIKYDGASISNFDKAVFEYDIYSEYFMDENDTIEVVANENN